MVRSEIGKIMRKCGIFSPTNAPNVGIDKTHCYGITDKALRGLQTLPWASGHRLMITPYVPIKWYAPGACTVPQYWYGLIDWTVPE